MGLEIIPVTRFEQNCSILWCEDTARAVVIDPGGNIDEILNYLDLLDITLEVILVTHGHFDHCGGAANLSTMTGARIEGPHEGDAPIVAGLEQAGTLYGISSRTFEPSRWLAHGDVIAFGNRRLQALHCPGHSRGHIAYFCAETRMAFVGDILFRGSIGAWEHADGDLRTLVHSIRNILFPLGDDVRFVPGHGPLSTFGREREDNPFVGDAIMAKWDGKLASPGDPALQGSDIA
jgi:glyoxylase-like metal-dependent hydrolase (beta-lactamase superfamily II)